MFCSHFLQGDENEKTSYRKFTNKLTKSIALAKIQHFVTLLETKKLNPNSAWEIIRSVLPTAKVKSSAAEDFINKNKSLDQKSIADLFNNFFCTIGKELDENIPKHQNNHYRNYLSKSVSESIF